MSLSAKVKRLSSIEEIIKARQGAIKELNRTQQARIALVLDNYRELLECRDVVADGIRCLEGLLGEMEALDRGITAALAESIEPAK